jgi:hypothetical protein
MHQHYRFLLSLTATLSCAQRSMGAIGATDGDADQAVLPVDPRTSVCPSPDAAPAAVTYPQIQRIFDQNCTSCHAGAAALDLRDQVSWGDLVNQPAPAPESCGGLFVTPGDPNGSYLYQKLTSPTPCYGSQMPLGEFYALPLPACVISIVQSWIVQGAPE